MAAATIAITFYPRPADLVAPGVADGGPFPNSGHVFRRTPTGKLVPYYDRGEIEDGALDGPHLEICWLRSAADALSIQIDGSQVHEISKRLQGDCLMAATVRGA
jgi:membrane-bound lytic murein transglycosylase A